MIDWYVLRAEPGWDERVARDLGDNGYEAVIAKLFNRVQIYEPKTAEEIEEETQAMRLRKSKAQAFRRPKVQTRIGVEADAWLSPYVFFAIDSERRSKSGVGQNLRDVRDTLGVESIVSLTTDLEGYSAPTRVPADVIYSLRHMENSDWDAARRRVRRAESRFRDGERVVVIGEGYANGMQGTVKETRHGLVVASLGPMGIPWCLAEDDFATLEGNIRVIEHASTEM